MKFDTTRVKRRRAISGVLAAILMFAMLFTVGTGYFLFINASNQLYDAAVVSNNSALQNRLSENLVLTTVALSNNDIGVYVNNTGGIGVNMTGLYLQYSGKSVTKCMGVGLPTSSCAAPTIFPSCQFPVYVNIGMGTKGILAKSGSGCATPPGTLTIIDTGQPANSTIAVLRVITQRGSVFTATYPPTATALAAQALSSGAIGDLYIDFGSYLYYSVTTSNCPSVTDASGYCLSSKSGSTGFTIPVSVTNTPIAFTIQVINYNPNKATVILDEFSFLSQLVLHGQNIGYVNWFIVSNSSTAILSHYTNVVLPYDVRTTLLFATTNPVCPSGVSEGGCQVLTASPKSNLVSQPSNTGSQLATGTEVASFIVTHACRGVGIVSCASSSANYGQNSPYVTTLYL